MLGEIADRYRTTVAFSTRCRELRRVARLSCRWPCPWFGVDLDPVAILGHRRTSDEIFSRSARSSVTSAHDAVRGADRRTKAVEIGRGNVNWQELFQSLEGAGYHGCVTTDT